MSTLPTQEYADAIRPWGNQQVEESEQITDVVQEPPQTGAQEKKVEKQRILVMDDDEAVCEIATQMLSFLGYDVDISLNGDEAVEKYQEAMEKGQPFDAVILDLTIPDGPGAEETVKRLEAIDPNVIALISSGYFDDPAICEFRDHGFSGAIVKPFRMKALASVLKTTLAQGRDGGKC